METTLRSTELLRADHQGVMIKLDALQRVVNARNGSQALTPVIQDLGTFFRTGIWALVWKEEDVLFPAVRPFLPRKQDAIARMRHDHAALRGANDRFQSAVDTYLTSPSDPKATAAIRESGARIVTLLSAHIPAEDQALLSVADKHLSASQDQRMIEAFKTIDADLAWGFENLEEFYP